MASIDLAKRAYDHGWRLDPIVRSLLDTDFYKLLMLQLIWRRFRDAPVTFSVINRTNSVRLAEEVDEAELRAQLDHARSLRFTNRELIWLGGNTFYGVKSIFSPDFLAWLADYRLPDYDLSRSADGQFRLEFSGSWADVTLWEIPALSILNELRSRRALRRMGRFELDILYSRAKTKLWSKIERLRQLEPLALSDFGTRRRHGFLWQGWCVEALKEGLGSAFIGTSNVLLAMNNDLEAIGTNGHELPMVLAAMAGEDEAALAGRLEGFPSRFRTADRGRRDHHEVVGVQGPRPARASAGPGRRAGRGRHRGGPRPLQGPGTHQLRLGHQSDQRLPRLRAGRGAGTVTPVAGLQGDQGGGPSGGETVGQRRKGHRRPGRDRTLSARVRRGGTRASGRARLRRNR